MTAAYHMVHYRRLDRAPPDTPKATLEAQCRDALDVVDIAGVKLWERAQDRLHDLADDGKCQILLNKVADLSSAVFGEMCLMQASDLQTLLNLTTERVQLTNISMVEIFGLAERTAPQGSKFVRGMLYWLAVGDHLFYVKTQAMTSELLGSYLNWLLNRNVPPADLKTFSFRSEFDKSQLGGGIGEVRSLRVSGKSVPQLAILPHDALPKDVAVTRKVADRFVEFAQALPVIVAIFGQKKAESLVSSLGAGEYLSVDAEVKVRGRRTVQSQERLAKLADELADLTDGKVQVEGRDGKISDGDAILRTRMPFDLPNEGSNLLDFNNVADQLQEVYRRFVKDGKLSS